MKKRLTVLPLDRESDSPLRKGVFLLPNLVTTAGLFAGFYAVIATLNGHYELAAAMILLAQVFDALDGRIARLTGTTSRFGVEYDSLADLVAFGVAPGILAYHWALVPWGKWGWLAASLYVTCGALRLARFNVQVDSVEKRTFVGLPIPAAAAMIAATVLLYFHLGGEGETHKRITLLLMIYGLAGLMVSSLPYFSFKDVPWRSRQPFWLLIAFVAGLNLLLAQPQVVLFTVITAYVATAPLLFLLRQVGILEAAVEEGPGEDPADETDREAAP